MSKLAGYLVRVEYATDSITDPFASNPTVPTSWTHVKSARDLQWTDQLAQLEVTSRGWSQGIRSFVPGLRQISATLTCIGDSKETDIYELMTRAANRTLTWFRFIEGDPAGSPTPNDMVGMWYVVQRSGNPHFDGPMQYQFELVLFRLVNDM